MKIIVSDFDLTFYDNNFIKNIDLINKWVNKNNKFIIATGRSLIQLKKTITNYKIKASYYICNDGGVIYDDNFKEIYRQDIDSKTSQILFNYLKNTKYFSEVFIDTSKSYTTIDTSICNCLIGRIINKNDAIIALNYILKHYPNVHGYISTNWLNITDISVTKANGIKFLSAMHNWNKSDIYTIGDDINDVSMLSEYNGYFIKRTDNINIKNIKIVNSFEEAFGDINESN